MRPAKALRFENKSVEPVRRVAKVTFLPERNRGKAILGETILGAGSKLGIDLSSLCAGYGTCGKCKIVVARGGENLNDPTPSERRFFSAGEIKSGCNVTFSAKLLDNRKIFGKFF